MVPSPSEAILASLSLEALRQGQSLWFRVASGSMSPILQVNDEIYIVPTQACEINRGDIAAFETGEGLMVHRIVYMQSQGKGATRRLLQMSDVVLQPTWLQEQAIVGRVIIVRHDAKQLSLRHPVAKWGGWTIATIRYQLYLRQDVAPVRKMLRACSHITLSIGYWIIQQCSIPSQK